MKPGLLWGILFGAVAVNSSAADESIFSCRVGAFQVHTLVENRGQGRPSILIGADEALLNRYLPGGTYGSETNTFLIRGPGRIILVDTGFGAALFDHLRALGVEPAQVDAVLITHMHGDHIGGLQRDGKPLFPRAKVYLARQEKEFWVDSNAFKGSTQGSAAAAALAPYGSRVETFQPGGLDASGGELFPGIRPVAAFGHTPGHTLFLVESDGQKLLIAGDLFHVQDIQFPRPDISVTYDTDPAAAAAVRKRTLDYAAANSIPIAGMHLRYPAIGTVKPDGTGFRLVNEK